MFKQEQRGAMAGGFENQETETFVPEDERMEQMGFEGDSTNENTHVSESQAGNNNDSNGLGSISLADRKEIDIYKTGLSAMAVSNAKLFDPEETDQAFISSSTPEPLKTNLLTRVKTSGINPVIAFGAKRLAMHLVSGSSPWLPVDHSVTFPLDFGTDRPDLVKIKASAAYTSADPATKAEADTAFTGVQAFRITSYNSGGQTSVLVEGLGNATKRGSESDGNTLLEKHNIEFESDATRSLTEPNEIKKVWTDVEKKKVRSAFAILPDAVLASISGMKLQRAAVDQLDIDARSAAEAAGQPLPDPGTSAEYSSGNHSLTVYDWGLEDRLNIYGDSKSGFTNRLQATIAHEVGHAVDNNPIRLARNSFNKAVDVFNADSDASFKEDQNFTNHSNAVLNTFNQTKTDANNNLNKLESDLVALYNEKIKDPNATGTDELLIKLNDLQLLYTGGISSTGVQIIVWHDYDKATSRQQYENMASIIKAITEVDVALVNKTANLIVAVYDGYVLYKNTSDFLKQVREWGDSSDQNKPVIPADIDQKIAKSYIDAVEKFKNSSADYEIKKTADENSKTLTGYGSGETTSKDNTPDLTKSDFRIAAGKDFGSVNNVPPINRITAYADDSWSEFFADSFSAYMTDPGRFSLLRPYLFSYFEKQYGVWKDKYPVVQ